MKYFNILCWTWLISLLAGTSIQARDLGEGAINESPSKALQNSQNFYELWSGVGQLRLESGDTCSAVLLDTRNRQGLATGPAYLLTSGHCVFFQYGSARLNLPLNAQITFHYFHDTPQRQRRYNVHTAQWSSLAGTDLAVLEVNASLATLIRAGINPLKLADHNAHQSHDVLNVGAPDGFIENGLRMSACAEQTAGSFIDHPGVFPLALQNRCDLHPGSSGSPMLDRGTNKITGIVSKVRDLRSAPVPLECEPSSTCDVGPFNYSYSANFLHKCFVDGVFTSDAAQCLLSAGDITVMEPWKVKSQVFKTQNESGQIVLPTWDFRFAIEAPFYRYKTVRDARDCQDPRHFSTNIDSQEAYINDDIGPQNGAHALCIIETRSEQQSLTRAVLNNVFMMAVHLAPSESENKQPFDGQMP